MSAPHASFSMYTHGPGSNIVPDSAAATTASAFGWPRATRSVPSSGSTATSTGHALVGADALAVEEHRRLVLLALADHDHAVHLDRRQHVAHRVDGGPVGGDLVAEPDPAGARERGRLGHPHELECEVSIRCFCHEQSSPAS